MSAKIKLIMKLQDSDLFQIRAVSSRQWKLLTMKIRSDDVQAFDVSVAPVGHKIDRPYPIFQRLTDEEVADYKARFGGQQSEETN